MISSNAIWTMWYRSIVPLPSFRSFFSSESTRISVPVRPIPAEQCTILKYVFIKTILKYNTNQVGHLIYQCTLAGRDRWNIDVRVKGRKIERIRLGFRARRNRAKRHSESALQCGSVFCSRRHLSRTGRGEVDVLQIYDLTFLRLFSSFLPLCYCKSLNPRNILRSGKDRR